MTQAKAAFSDAFGYSPDVSMLPTDVTGPSTENSKAELLAGFRAAAFSQLAMDIGLSQNVVV